MTMRSWLLKSWPEAICAMPSGARDWPLFHHMGTLVSADRDDQGRCVGETVWAARTGSGGVLGAAWEWVELRPGVPALRDPNGFVSNARFVDARGREVDELEAIVGLNHIAHTTAWHRAVRDAVRQSEMGGQPAEQAMALEWPRALGLVDQVAPFPRRGVGRTQRGPSALAA
jgi:hypothetical protein